ncbi:MAG: pentapeptide repeat-containing protein [Sphingobacteriia bacterium]|nr:pentapeptide repeat-containing protein [Sphingobacteriia bacterium]
MVSYIKSKTTQKLNELNHHKVKTVSDLYHKITANVESIVDAALITDEEVNIPEENLKLVEDTRDRLLEFLQNEFKENISTYRDIFIIREEDFSSPEGQNVLNNFSDFSNVIFKHCTFPAINKKNFQNAIFENCEFVGDIEECNLTNTLFINDESYKPKLPNTIKKNININIKNCTFSVPAEKVSFEDLTYQLKGLGELNIIVSKNPILYDERFKKMNTELKELFLKHIPFDTWYRKSLCTLDSILENSNNVANNFIFYQEKFIENLKSLNNIPSNATVDFKSHLNSYNRNIYKVTEIDLVLYFEELQKERLMHQEHNSKVIDELNKIKDQLDTVTILTSYIYVLKYLSESKDITSFNKALLELRSILSKSYDPSKILTPELLSLYKNVSNCKGEAVKNDLNQNLMSQLLELNLSLKDKFRFIRNKIKTVNFKDFVIKKHKLNSEYEISFDELPFFKADFMFADFSGCFFRNINCNNGTLFNFVNFNNCTFKDSSFSGDGEYFFKKYFQFKGASFESAFIVNTDFSCSDLEHSVFSDAIIKNSDLSKAKITGADFASSTIFNSNLNRINSSEVDFSSSIITYSNFDNSKLENTSFIEAFLYKNSMRNCELIRCNFEKAYIENLDSSFTKFKECIFNDTQKLIMEGRKQKYELCSLKNAKYIELGKDFETLGIHISQNELQT